MTEIPNRDSYYLKDGVFRLKSKWSKRFRIGFAIGILIGGMIPFTTTSHINSDDLVGLVYPPTKESMFIDYITKENTKVTQKEADSIVKSVMKWSEKFDIKPELILAVMRAESNFDRLAVSSAGAFGYMQVMTNIHLPKVLKAKSELGNPEPFATDTNIFLGTWVLKQCYDKYSVDSSSLKCYNGSNGIKTDYDNKVLVHLKNIMSKVKERV